MMDTIECVAMIFAGERGAGLGALTDSVNKSAVLYGGGYRIIDFALSNCSNSGINTVGVLTRSLNDGLHSYIGDGRSWGLSGHGKGVHMLPASDYGDYKGVIDAVYRNVDFIERFSPKYVCILSGSLIYNMDYSMMLDYHKKKNADATIAYAPVSPRSRYHYGLVYPDETGLVLDFEEKSTTGKSNFASIGACIMNWETLKKYITPDFVCKRSSSCFGLDIIPAILSSSSETMYAYRFDGYWREVDTLESLWESNMDLLGSPPGFVINEEGREVYTSSGAAFSSYNLHSPGDVKQSILSGTGVILGKVDRSVLSDSVFIGKGAEVVDSIIMPNVYIGNNAKVYKTIVGSRSHIMDGAEIGVEGGTSAFVSNLFCKNGISLIASWVSVGEKTKLQKNSYVGNGISVDSFSCNRSGELQVQKVS